MNNHLDTDKFIGDDQFFYTDFQTFIKTNDFTQILDHLKKKHIYEISIEKDIDEKKYDLIIWNAFLSKEIIKDKIIKIALHDVYNFFYLNIIKCNSLVELQELEIKMFEKYTVQIINNMEITSNFAVNRILHYLHMHVENYFSLNEMAGELNNSPSYLSSLFSKTMGISIVDYIHDLKINRAKILLKTTSKNILEISQLLGYCDSSHFSKKFKEKQGVSPLSYRNDKLIK
ncbi:helix-turn-helix transcriptional regulator [Clostridium sp. MB05]|jgi:AraC-like DNA-binding protein